MGDFESDKSLSAYIYMHIHILVSNLGDVGVGDGEMLQVFKWGIVFAIGFILLAELIGVSGTFIEKIKCSLG